MRGESMNRRQFAQAVAALPAVVALSALPARELYRIDAAQAFARMIGRINEGGEFDREFMRYEYEAQLLRERHNLFLWDGPTTARGFRHPAWPTS
ncbi:hypothetical protein D8770_21850 [Methylobacterium sp. DB1607]|nr:hypothetical protein [Methylobacterium sp. DB1607]